MRVIGSPNGRNFWMIVSRDSVGSLNELRGQAYAISRVGSEDHALALTVMRAKGVDSSEPLMSNTSAATVGVVRDKSEALRRYTRAMLQTARYYAQHKEEWVRDMGTLRPDIQANDLSDLWDQFKTAWAVNGQLNLGTFQKTSDYLYATDDSKSCPRSRSASGSTPSSWMPH
jgi:hypothetical protein